MAKLGKIYETETLPEDDGASAGLVPKGWYTVSVDKSELRDTRAGNGQYIALQLRVQGPTHANRVVFANITTANVNQKAQEIGDKQLGSLLRACGIQRFEDTDQLVGCILDAKVRIKPGTNGYEDSNDVAAYRAPSGPVPVPAPPQQTQQSDDMPPWMR